MMDETAVNLFQQSEAARKRGDAGAAKKLVQSALLVDEDVPGAWYNLSTDYHHHRQLDAAIASIKRCVEISVPMPQSWTNLGWNLQVAGRHQEAFDALVKATDLGPDMHLGWMNLCLSATSLHKPEDIAYGRRAVELAPDDPASHMALAFALMLRGFWAEGLKEYEWRFRYKLPEFLNYPMPKWEGQYVDTLFIPSEQGLGDTLQFGRFVSLAAERVGRVIMCAQEELASLVRHPWAPGCPQIEILTMPAPIPKADAFCPMMSLPVAMELEDCEVPDVPAKWFWTPESSLALKPVTKRRKIGICWAGSPDQDNDRHRSAMIEDFLGLYDRAGIQLYSLQVGDRARECRPYSGLVHDLSSKIRDFSDTADFIQQMDAVVTVCTAVAHLSGALGVPTHVILPRHGQHFVWGHHGRITPWYPAVRLYRQERMGDWRSVIEEVVESL